MSSKSTFLQKWEWSALWQSVPWWGQCFALWLGAWAILTSAGFVGLRVLGLREGFPSEYELPADSLPGLWTRWDAGQYLVLAYQGYENAPEYAGYFPLYPMLMGGLFQLTGLEAEISGPVISQLSYLAAILLLYKLARRVRDDHRYAMGSVLAMLLFPTSFFFFALYAESLYLAFAILALYLVLGSRPRYAWAGLALGVASAARPIGWLLNIVPLAEFVRRRQFNARTLLALGAGLALSVSSIIGFVLYLYAITGSFMAIPNAQTAWERRWQIPLLTLWHSLQAALTGSGWKEGWFMVAVTWSDLIFTILALGVTAYAVWRSTRGEFHWGLSLYLIGSLLFLLSSESGSVDPLWGMARWVATLFPVYLVLGELSLHQSRLLRWGVAVASGVWLLALTAWWISGRWVG
jgi:hypothetical protein